MLIAAASSNKSDLAVACQRNKNGFVRKNVVSKGSQWFTMGVVPEVNISYDFSMEDQKDYPITEIKGGGTLGKRHGTYFQLPRISLNWGCSNPQCLLAKNDFDILCVYNIQHNSEENVTKAVLMDGFLVDYYPSKTILLPDKKKYKPSQVDNKIFVVRYEHKKEFGESCDLPLRLVDAHSGTVRHVEKSWTTWGDTTIVLPAQPLTPTICKMEGNPPAPAFVELTLNGQDFHGAISLYTYFDADYSTSTDRTGKVCNPKDDRSVFSFSLVCLI